MIVWDDAQTTYQKLTKDTSDENLTFGKLMMNQGYKVILSEFGTTQTERTQTTSTQENQQAYQAPPDFLWIKTITATVGSSKYPLIEEESQDEWDRRNFYALNSEIPEYFFVRPRFGVGGAEILLYPIPSSDAVTLTMVYEATDRDKTQNAYSTGTVTLQNGQTTVSGSGTTFTAAMVGRYLRLTSADGDGLWYRIASYTNPTTVALENSYEGADIVDANYQISEAFALPEDMHLLPVYFAAWHYWSGRQKKEKTEEFFSLFDGGLKAARKTYGTKSRSNLIKPKGTGGMWDVYPSNFPQGGVTG